MKNFTFKVIPNQANLENKKKPIYEEPIMSCPPKKECPKHETPPMPCPPQEPTYEEPVVPCPPMPCPPIHCPHMPMPCPPQEPIYEEPVMPCPPMEPECPQMPCPCPPMEPECPQHSGNSAPPFTCPYFRLAHAYVPWQYLNTVFSPAEALCKGTLFPELNMPQGQYGPCEGPRPCKVYFGGGVPYGCK